MYSPHRELHGGHKASRGYALESPIPQSPNQGISKLWQEDMVEHRLREMVRSRKRDATPGHPVNGMHVHGADALRAMRTERDAALHSQRSLQMQLSHEREENRNLENEVIAFKQRMEAAISSFEGIVEQAAQEKGTLLSQLQAARQQAEIARQQDMKVGQVRSCCLSCYCLR
jgi:hypothetical protein